MTAPFAPRLPVPPSPYPPTPRSPSRPSDPDPRSPPNQSCESWVAKLGMVLGRQHNTEGGVKVSHQLVVLVFQEEANHCHFSLDCGRRGGSSLHHPYQLLLHHPPPFPSPPPLICSSSSFLLCLSLCLHHGRTQKLVCSIQTVLLCVCTRSRGALWFGLGNPAGDLGGPDHFNQTCPNTTAHTITPRDRGTNQAFTLPPPPPLSLTPTSSSSPFLSLFPRPPMLLNENRQGKKYEIDLFASVFF